MPTYTIKDPQSGKTITLKGDSPPSEAELSEIFAKVGGQAAAPAPAAAAAPPQGLAERVMAGAVKQTGIDPNAEVMGGPIVPMGGMAAAGLRVVSGGGGGAATAGLAERAGGLAQRVASGVKSVAATGAPMVKYEAVRMALEGAGLPPAVAMPLAMAVSGYKRGAKPAAGAAPAAVAPAPAVAAEAAPMAAARPSVAPAPVAPPPVAPAPQAAPVARGSAAPPTAASSPALPVMSPQRIQNELGLASRRANLKLTEPQYAEAAQLVKQGNPPMEAVRQVSGGQAAPVAAPAAQVAAKPKLTAAETREYVRLRSAGKSHQQAAEALEAQRTLMQKLGTPSPEQARQAVATRNSTGRWRR